MTAIMPRHSGRKRAILGRKTVQNAGSSGGPRGGRAATARPGRYLAAVLRGRPYPSLSLPCCLLLLGAVTATMLIAPDAAHAANPPLYNRSPEFPSRSQYTAAVHEYPPAPGGGGVSLFQTGITVGPDGNTWFGEAFPNGIVRITPAGSQTVFPVSESPGDITTGPDHNLWIIFSQVFPAEIGRMTPSGALQTFQIPGPPGCPGCNPSIAGIVAGPDGGVWFTGNGFIGRIDPTTGAIQQFPIHTSALT